MERKRKFKAAERLEKQKIARRRRYAEIKADPIMYELEKKKEKERYKKRKNENQFKSINEESPRDQREKRKKWREAAKKYRLKKKEQLINKPIITDAVDIEALNEEHNKIEVDSIDPLTIPPECPQHCFTKIRRIRYTEQKKRKLLIGIIEKLSQQNKQLKLKLTQYQEKQPKHKKKVYRNPIVKTEKYKDPKLRKVVTLVREFYLDDENSTIGAGKKEYITRLKIQKQKRYMTSTQKVLHKKFMIQNRIKVSYTFFCKYRPFWVLSPKKSQRDLCRCIIHENIDLALDALKKASIINEGNSGALMNNLCCSIYEAQCLRRECPSCKNKTINIKEFINEEIIYQRWNRTREVINTKKGKKTLPMVKKEEVIAKPRDVIAVLNANLPAFFDHCYKIHNQYINMKELKDTMPVNYAIIHADFSENYNLKFNKEVQSMHFGGSRNEVCLHTAVIYTFDFHISSIKATSVCTASSCLRHDASAVWAHITPLIEKCTEMNPFIDTLHFQTDSPVSQYRNKYIFFMITQLVKEFPHITKITWNYTEAGHGKGAPDGVGATIKRTADSFVNHGGDIGTYDKFMHVIRQNVENVIMFDVTEECIKEKEQRFPDNLLPFRGTLAVHQVLWQKGDLNLTFRKLSCFKCSPGVICAHGNHLGFLSLPQSYMASPAIVDKDSVTLLAATKKQNNIPLGNITNTTTILANVAGPSNVRILSNRAIIIKKASLKNCF